MESHICVIALFSVHRDSWVYQSGYYGANENDELWSAQLVVACLLAGQTRD